MTEINRLSNDPIYDNCAHTCQDQIVVQVATPLIHNHDVFSINREHHCRHLHRIRLSSAWKDRPCRPCPSKIYILRSEQVRLAIQY